MTTNQRPRILCVDDEPLVLAGLANTLRRRFDVTTAVGGQEGLRALGDQGPFSVVVSDFMMPGMNGAEFLSFARVASPDAVRILLTGQASLENAVSVVNEGNIFRFLTKPCAPADLVRALDDAVDQARLLTADTLLVERKLETVSVQLLRAERLASTGSLAGAIGHELTAIAGQLVAAVTAIRSEAAAGRAPSPDDIELLTRMQDRLQLHARKLLDLGQPPAQPPGGATEMKGAVHGALGVLRAAGLLKQARIRLDLPVASVPVRMESAALERVLLNVIKNAVEAVTTSPHADPTVTIGIAAAGTPDSTVCTVSDNGPGIPANDVPLVFEPYFTTKAPGSGAGLGLFAVQQMMRTAGGEVSVAPRPEGGTTFTLRLAAA